MKTIISPSGISKNKKTLADDFKSRDTFFTNRASAIFPIFFLNFDNDLILVWLNYWTIKNGINQADISINLRIYDAYGLFITRAEIKENFLHNKIF